MSVFTAGAAFDCARGKLEKELADNGADLERTLFAIVRKSAEDGRFYVDIKLDEQRNDRTARQPFPIRITDAAFWWLLRRANDEGFRVGVLVGESFAPLDRLNADGLWELPPSPVVRLGWGRVGVRRPTR